MPSPAKLTGAVLGTAGSYQGAGAVVSKAFDGNLATFFDAPGPSGNWVGLDFGGPQTISQISYAPRTGWNSRMVGGQFQVANKADFSDAITVLTVKIAPPVGVLTSVAVGPTVGRYARYVAPSGSFGNISEVQFFGSPVPVPSPVIVVAPVPSAYPQDSAGWSIPRTPTVSYFIDPINGSDSNPANTQSKPHKTPAPFLKAQPANAALLFNAGSTSTQALALVHAPGLYIGRYGNPTAPNPIIQVASGTEFGKFTGDNTLIQDLDIRSTGGNKGIETAANSFRAEGISLTGFYQGILPGPGNGCVIFRCNISHNYKAAHATSGAYSNYVAGLVIAECVINQNGWNGLNPATSDEYSHGWYADDDTKNPFNPIIVERCIIANNSAWGVEGRPGGTADDNLLIDNGLHGGGLFLGGTSSEIKNNVCTGALDSPARSTGRGDGLWICGQNGSLHHNLACNPCGQYGAAFGISTVTSNQLQMLLGTIDVFSNAAIGWRGNGIAIYSARKRVNMYGNAIDADGYAVNYHVPPVNDPTTGKPALTAHDNSYRSGAMFLTGDKGAISRGAWATMTNENGGAIAPGACSATIENYAQSVGLAPSGQALLARAQANCIRSNYDQRFIASSINDYFRGAAGMSRG